LNQNLGQTCAKIYILTVVLYVEQFDGHRVKLNEIITY